MAVPEYMAFPKNDPPLGKGQCHLPVKINQHGCLNDQRHEHLSGMPALHGLYSSTILTKNPILKWCTHIKEKYPSHAGLSFAETNQTLDVKASLVTQQRHATLQANMGIQHLGLFPCPCADPICVNTQFLKVLNIENICYRW